MIERKIYNSWAFSENEDEKSKINYQIFKEELQPISKKFWGSNRPTENDLKEFTCYERSGSGYATAKYRILSNPHNLSTLQLALICDDGNLCFGYRTEGSLIVIHTD